MIRDTCKCGSAFQYESRANFSEDVHRQEMDALAKWLKAHDVPDDFLCPGDNGYGDYIILKVGADGQIEKWRTPAVEMVCECDEDAQHGWKKLPNARLSGRGKQDGTE